MAEDTSNKSVAAIVVARGGSIRLPRKALLPFAGTTLIANKIRQLRACGEVSAVYVNTDDYEIRDAAVAEGALPLDGKDYAGDANAMIADSVAQVREETILWAHPTNPLVSAATYDHAICTFNLMREIPNDSLVSVMVLWRHAWFDGKPLNHNPWSGRHKIGSYLVPVCFQDGAIFIQPRLQMLENRSFYGKTPCLFYTPTKECADIDTHADYLTALSLYQAIGHGVQ